MRRAEGKRGAREGLALATGDGQRAEEEKEEEEGAERNGLVDYYA